MNTKKMFGIYSIFTFILLTSCTNPFAPKISLSPENNINISDQTTVKGVFDNFRYAYMLRDTIVYGNLLADDFTFTYHDYELGMMKSWGRDEDMISTSGLFQASQSLDLLWNEVGVYVSTSDSLITDISRGFTLTIVFSATDVVKIQGRANLRLKRILINGIMIWKISMWKDESNY
ncbi:MAG: hypothetical protein Q8M94_09750 [Ignavibacteria bacterium]|nr:hypothetical protein [Ignavibacteria bacterium]